MTDILQKLDAVESLLETIAKESGYESDNGKQLAQAILVNIPEIRAALEGMRPLYVVPPMNLSDKNKAAFQQAGSIIAVEHEYGWQPIETAPEAETILLCNKFNQVGIGQLYAGESQKQANVGGATGTLHNNFTHWMPLPTPPKGGSDGNN